MTQEHDWYMDEDDNYRLDYPENGWTLSVRQWSEVGWTSYAISPAGQEIHLGSNYVDTAKLICEQWMAGVTWALHNTQAVELDASQRNQNPAGPFHLRLSRHELYALHGAVSKDHAQLAGVWKTTQSLKTTSPLQGVIDKLMTHTLDHLQAILDRLSPMKELADTYKDIS